MPPAVQVVRTLATHAVLLIVVTIVPPLVSDWVESSSVGNIYGMFYVGGITYPVYATYITCKLRSRRTRLVAFSFIFFATTFCVVNGLTSAKTSNWIIAFPTLLGILPLLVATYLAVRRKVNDAKTFLLIALILLPVGLALSVLLMLGEGLSGMPRNMGDTHELRPRSNSSIERTAHSPLRAL